jgi:hypothetical protein
MKLTIELVPKTAWFKNLRSELPKDLWDRLRTQVYKNANYVCEICGGIGPTHPVECHEVWSYDNTNKVQKLERLIALCPACHEVKHMGLAAKRGRQDIALRHLAEVNGWSLSDARTYAEACFELWAKQSKHKWTTDLHGLTQYGVREIDLPQVIGGRNGR